MAWWVSLLICISTYVVNLYLHESCRERMASCDVGEGYMQCKHWMDRGLFVTSRDTRRMDTEPQPRNKPPPWCKS